MSKAGVFVTRIVVKVSKKMYFDNIRDCDLVIFFRVFCLEELKSLCIEIGS